MLPTTDSLPVWPLIILLFPVAVAFHELGHTIFGRLAGLRILAFGIGFERVLFNVKAFGTCFYLGRPLLSGLCIPSGLKSLERPLVGAFFAAGGPVFSLLGTIVTWYLWQAGSQSILLIALFYAMLICTIISTIPMEVPLAGSRQANDAMTILRCLRRSDTHKTSLISLDVLENLFRSINVWDGVAEMTLAKVTCLAAFDDVQSAREMLEDECLSDPRRKGSDSKEHLAAMEAYARAMVASAEDAASSLDAIHKAQQVCDDIPTFLIGLKILESYATSVKGENENARRLAYTALQMANETKLCTLITSAEVNIFQVAPPKDDLAATCQEFLERKKHRRLTQLQRMLVAMIGAKTLAERGKRDSAIALTQEARSAMDLASKEIGSEKAMERFLEKHEKTLAEVYNSLDEEEVVSDKPEATTTKKKWIPLWLIIVSIMAIVAGTQYSGCWIFDQISGADVLLLLFIFLMITISRKTIIRLWNHGGMYRPLTVILLCLAIPIGFVLLIFLELLLELPTGNGPLL